MVEDIVKDKLKRPPLHIIEGVMRKKNEIRQSIPESLYDTIVNFKKIEYRGKKIKTSKIATFCDMLYKKREKKKIGKGDNIFILNSTILQQRFGCEYRYLISYLTANGYIVRHLGYKPGFKSTTYRMTQRMIDTVPRVYLNFDKVTVKNYKENVLSGIIKHNKLSEDILKGLNFNDTNNIPNYIHEEIRSKMILDLYTVDIDCKKAMGYTKLIKCPLSKYYNTLRIMDINDKHIWYQFDNYGRFHTNYTVLKRAVRNTCLCINGEEIGEIDIQNSQPLLLAKIIKDSGMVGSMVSKDEFDSFVELVKEGMLYQHFIDVFKYKNKSDVKKNLIYKVLFGDNTSSQTKANRIFNKAFPTIFNFIKEYKSTKKDYKSLSHELQRIESELIYNKIIKDIMLKDISISLFTVHDSICYPISNKILVEEIFNKHVNHLINSI